MVSGGLSQGATQPTWVRVYRAWGSRVPAPSAGGIYRLVLPPAPGAHTAMGLMGACSPERFIPAAASDKPPHFDCSLFAYFVNFFLVRRTAGGWPCSDCRSGLTFSGFCTGLLSPLVCRSELTGSAVSPVLFWGFLSKPGGWRCTLSDAAIITPAGQSVSCLP